MGGVRVERVDAVGDVVVGGRVPVQRVGPGRNVAAAGGVPEQRLEAIGRVVVARTVFERAQTHCRVLEPDLVRQQCLVADRRVAGAGGVGRERERAERRVAVDGRVAVQRAPADGRAPVAAGVRRQGAIAHRGGAVAGEALERFLADSDVLPADGEALERVTSHGDVLVAVGERGHHVGPDGSVVSALEGPGGCRERVRPGADVVVRVVEDVHERGLRRRGPEHEDDQRHGRRDRRCATERAPIPCKPHLRSSEITDWCCDWGQPRRRGLSRKGARGVESATPLAGSCLESATSPRDNRGTMALPRHSLSPPELAAMLEAEREGAPFLAYRDASAGELRLRPLRDLERATLGRSRTQRRIAFLGPGGLEDPRPARACRGRLDARRRRAFPQRLVRQRRARARPAALGRR